MGTNDHLRQIYLLAFLKHAIMKEDEGMTMVKVLLICSAGISGQRICEKMNEYVEKHDLDVKILAISDGEKTEKIPKADIILLGPQIRFSLDDVKALAMGKFVKVMDSQNYGLLRGDLILKDALEDYGILV